MNVVVDEIVAYHIIREWLVDFVYAGMPVPEITLEGQISNLVSDLKRGVDPRTKKVKVTRDISEVQDNVC